MESKNHQEKYLSKKEKAEYFEKIRLAFINYDFFRDEIKRLQEDIDQAHKEIEKSKRLIVTNNDMIIANRRGIKDTEKHLIELQSKLKIEVQQWLRKKLLFVLDAK